MKEKQPRSNRSFVFTLAAILLPIIFLVMLEGFLRLINYGGDLRLVRTTEVYGKKYYQLNSGVGERYFHSKYLAVPEMYPELFEYQKSDNTFRIFCLGGSTTAGFPFEMNARFTSMLEARLNDLYKGKYNFEVINVGMSAINSFSVLDFTKELVQYNPDLFIIYMGHNEFYGALGVGSTESFGKNRNLILLYLQLRKFRTVRLMKDLIAGIYDLVTSNVAQKNQATLMENVVKNKAIPFNSKEYELASKYFQKNLERIINIAKRNDVKVLVSTLVCNLKDQKPFMSRFLESTSPESKSNWKQLLRSAMMDLEKEDDQTAAQKLQKAVRIDSNHANGYYQLGKVLEGLGKYNAAYEKYRRAADYDELRFRASSQWNHIVKDVAAENGIPVVHMENAFANASPHGLIGQELIYEHLHPNFEGYGLMAQTFCKALFKNKLIPQDQDIPSFSQLSSNGYRRLVSATPMDIKLAEWRIRKLTSRWPFTDRMNTTRLQPANWMDSLAVAYLQKEIPWSDVHYKAARHYEKMNQYTKAIPEYRAIARIRPDAYYPQFRIGSLYLEIHQPRKALPLLERAKMLNSASPFVSYKLGTARLLCGHYKEAASELQNTLDLDSKEEQLALEEKVRVRYALSLAMIQLGKQQQAIPHLEWIGRRQPMFKSAAQLLEKFQKGEKVSIQFEEN